MPAMTPQELRNAVLSSAISDAGFLAKIRENGPEAVAERYGVQTYDVKVALAQENEFPILIPCKTPDVARSVAKVVAEAGSEVPTLKQFNCAVVQQVWDDPTLLARLQETPTATFNELVQHYRVELPPEITPLVCAEKENECCIVIPGVVPSNEQLKDADLEAVAGGAIATGTAIAVAGVAAAVANILDDWGGE